MSTMKPATARRPRGADGLGEAPAGNTAAARFDSRGPTTRSTSGTCSSTTSSSSAAAGAARALRGLRPLRARHPLAALGAHRGHLRAREPQARLLPLDGVSHRPLAGQQRHEPPARSRSPSRPSSRRTSTGSACSNRNPTRAWATAASGAWRPASSIRWPRCSSRRWATACATNTACSGRPSRTAGSSEQPDNWLRRPDPWEVARPHEKVEVKLNCSFEMRGGSLARHPRQAVHADRHPVRPPGGRLRRQDHQHAPALGRGGARLLRLPGVQQRRLRRRGGRDARRPNRSRASSIPTTPRAWGRGCASCRSISWSPARWPTSCGASAAATPTGTRCPRRSPSSSTTRTRDGGPGTDADPAGRGAARLGPGLGPHAADAGLHQPHAAARSPGEMAGRLVRDAAAAPPGDHLRDQPPLPRRRSAAASPATRAASRASA